jgi:hypothetical protein
MFVNSSYNVCDPRQPATAEYYLDCAKARGDGALTARFVNHLRQMRGQRSAFLFSGHIGCGKSSELEQVRYALESQSINGKRYFPVKVDYSEYVYQEDCSSPEIILAIVTELAATFRERLGVELQDGYFTSRFEEIKDFLLSDVEMKDFTVTLPLMKAKLQRLQRDRGARESVRRALHPKMPTIVEEINTVFAEARAKLRDRRTKDGHGPFDDFVLILDDLEKTQGFDDKERGLPSQRELFLENAPRLNRMQAHILYTVPLELVRADGAKLMQQYDVELFVLPMIKVFERGSRQPYAPGVACLQNLLERRIATFSGGRDLRLEGDLFSREALEFLIAYSGGHVRNLLHFIRQASTFADESPLSLRAAQKGISGFIRIYSTSTPEAHWEKLVRLDLSDDQKIPGGVRDEDFAEMLENHSILEYVNGGDEEDVFAESEPWYGVNPIVRELQKFKSVKERLLRESLNSQKETP